MKYRIKTKQSITQISVTLPKTLVLPSTREPSKDVAKWEKKGKVDKLIQALSSPRLCADAAQALGRIGSLDAVLPLIPHTENRSKIARQNVAVALGCLADPRATEALINCLRDKKSDVRADAAWALGRIRDTRAVEPLIICLGDKDTEVYRNAAASLAEIGDSRAVEPLISCLGDKDEFLRSSASDALARFGEQTVRPLIRHLRERNKEFRAHAIWVLGEIRDPRAIEHLKPFLESKDAPVRASAEDALRKLRQIP